MEMSLGQFRWVRILLAAALVHILAQVGLVVWALAGLDQGRAIAALSMALTALLTLCAAAVVARGVDRRQAVPHGLVTGLAVALIGYLMFSFGALDLSAAASMLLAALSGWLGGVVGLRRDAVEE